MTYELIETSTESGRPLELYEFARDGAFFRFTSADTDQVYLTNTYTAIAIDRSSIGQTDQFEKSGLNIEFARDDSFASAFLAYSPDSPTTLTIFREHLSDGDDEFITYWKGRVAAVSATGSRIRLECESVFSSLKRQGLRAVYSRMCRHVLYDANCTVDQNEFNVPAIIYNIDVNNADFVSVTDYSNPYLVSMYSMDSVSGSTLTDDSGNGNNGTITGAIQDDGAFGKALVFDGVDDNVSTPTDLPETGEFCIAMRVQSSDTSGSLVSNNTLRISMGASSAIVVTLGATTLTSTTFMTGTEYAGVAVQRDADDLLSLWVNGVIEDSETNASSIGASSFYIGSDPDATDYVSAGIDQLRFMNTSFTDEFIKHFASEGNNPEDVNSDYNIDYFLAGMIQDEFGVKRFIKEQNGLNITYSYPFENSQENDKVLLFAGCRHTTTDCSVKFSNLLNYGGFPYFPTDDGPFSGRSVG